MNDDFSKRLRAAREARGLSIEEAAHATRLLPSHVMALEEGNLGRFPSPAYAKGFLTMYAKYLGVDVSHSVRAMDTAPNLRVTDFQYLSNRASEDAERKREAADPRYDFVVPEKDRSWKPLFIFAGVAVAALIAFIVWNNMNRIGGAITANPDDPDEIPMRPEPTPEPPVAPPPAPEPPSLAGTTDDAPPFVDEEIPRPRIISIPEGSVPAAVPVERTAATQPPPPAPEPEIPRAKPVSPVVSLAADDAAALAELGALAPRATDTPPAFAPEPPAAIEPEEDNSPLAADPNTIVLEPGRKTWVIIRSGPGGQPLFEDFLYPTAKPMRLPSGRYFIELRDPDAVEISRGGSRIAYSAPGVLVE